MDEVVLNPIGPKHADLSTTAEIVPSLVFQF